MRLLCQCKRPRRYAAITGIPSSLLLPSKALAAPAAVAVALAEDVARGRLDLRDSRLDLREPRRAASFTSLATDAPESVRANDTARLRPRPCESTLAESTRRDVEPASGCRSRGRDTPCEGATLEDWNSWVQVYMPLQVVSDAAHSPSIITLHAPCTGDSSTSDMSVDPAPA